MFFKKGKKEDFSKLPDLPELPQIPEIPEFPKQAFKPEYPAFKPDNQTRPLPIDLPTMPNAPDFNPIRKDEAAIKTELTGESPVGKTVKSYTKELDHEPEEFQVTQIMSSVPAFRDTPTFKPAPRPVFSRPMSKIVPITRPEPKPMRTMPIADDSTGGPVFVRIDKFQSSLRSLNEIKRRISDIENYLADIQELKAKEEQEIGEWEKEILELKNQIDSIEKNIFGKI